MGAGAGGNFGRTQGSAIDTLSNLLTAASLIPGIDTFVDGHHRLRAAKQLGLDKIPTQKVSLPYKGYKTINDLLWFD